MRTLAVVLLAAMAAQAYPLNADRKTGIRRLKGYLLAQEGKVKGPKIPPGGQWTEDRIQLRMLGNKKFDVTASTAKDPALQRGLEQIAGGRNESYGLALLDITDPANPRYAAVRENVAQLPGSVGKLCVATGLMNALKLAYPQPADREKLLKNTIRTADGFVISDGKTVPFYEDGWPAVVNRRIAVGDKFSLWEWADHMLSMSSNAAGAYTWKEVMLLKQFGKQYPPSPEQEKEYLNGTNKAALGKEAVEDLDEPLRAAGIDTNNMRLGTMFTSGGQKVVPGSKSTATPRELLRWLLKMEQGQIVDEWSSLELKKLIYFARTRYRYASAPQLNDAAVFFKSGSFFQCTPGQRCKPYAGTETNIMNSIAVVESGNRVYLVALMSNVLGTNSAVEHQRIGGLVEKLVQSLPAAGK